MFSQIINLNAQNIYRPVTHYFYVLHVEVSSLKKKKSSLLLFKSLETKELESLRFPLKKTVTFSEFLVPHWKLCSSKEV